MQRRPLFLGILCVTFTIGIDSPARADSDYVFTTNTSSLAGTEAALTFDFIAGGGAQANTISISDFITNGTIGSASTSGSVTGKLPGTLTLSNASFFNELQQRMTLGSTITFQLVATTNAPTGGSLPDTFSLFLLDPTGSFSLTNTKDPTGSNSLVTLQIDGTKQGNLSVYSSSGPSVPVTVTAGSGPAQAPEMDSSVAIGAVTILLSGLAILRSRRSEVIPG